MINSILRQTRQTSHPRNAAIAKALQKPTLNELPSVQNQQLNVSVSIDAISEKLGNIGAHIEDLASLLYERQDPAERSNLIPIAQGAQVLLSEFSQNIQDAAKSLCELGRIAEARGVDAAQKGGAA